MGPDCSECEKFLKSWKPGQLNKAKKQCKNDFKDIKKKCQETAKAVLKNTENPPDPTDACMDQGWCSAPAKKPVPVPTEKPVPVPTEKPVSVPTSLPEEKECLQCRAFLSKFNNEKTDEFNHNNAKNACKNRGNKNDCKKVVKDVKKVKPEIEVRIKACKANDWCD